MANPLLLYGGLSLAGGGLNALFGGDDEFQMSPEARQLYNILLGKYKTGDFGINPVERSNLISSLKGDIGEQSQTTTGNLFAGLRRRGVSGGGQLAGAAADVAAASNRAFGKGITDIDIANERLKRMEEAQTLNALTGLTGQQVYKPGEDLDFGGIAENLTLFSLLNKKPKKPTLMDLFYLGGQ